MSRIDDDDLDEGPETNRGIGPWNPPLVTVIHNDWSSDINDYDSEYWEGYYRSRAPRAREDTPNARERPSSTAWHQRGNEQKKSTHAGAPIATDRQVEIVKWLETSLLARTRSDNAGFEVFRGSRMSLRDGTEWDVVDWLLKERFVNHLEVAGFVVTCTTRDGAVASVAFQPEVVPAPFE